MNTTQITITCNTCCKPVSRPYRRIVAGKIVEGCVDKSHNGHVIASTNSGAWHNRKEAKKIRADTARHIREMLKR